jgi:hypothetical protein
MGVLFKHVQYWLTKEIHKYPIKKSKYIYVCLHISIWIFIGTVKKRCAENFSYSMVFLIWRFLWQLRELSVTNPRIRAYQKTTKEEKFSAHLFFTMPMKIRIAISRQPLRKTINIFWYFYEGTYIFTQSANTENVKQNTHQMKMFEISIFLAFFTENLVKLHVTFVEQCPID